MIVNSFGKVFPSPAVFSAYILLGLGIIAILSGAYLAVILILLGGLGAFSTTGVEIDTDNKQFRTYSSFFGFKTGNWKNLSNYPFLCIFKSKKRYSMFSQANVQTSYVETGFDIFLLNQSHRERILVNIAETKEQATEAAKELAAQLKIQLVQFNPKVPSRDGRNR